MNKIYKIIWSAAHKSWIVTSELAKGKQKSSNNRKLKLTVAPKFKILSAILLINGSLYSSFVLAGTTCSVSNLTEYADKLKSEDCTDVMLTGNIDLGSRQTIFDFGTRDTINIEGNNQYSITNPGSMKVTGGSPTNQVNLNFKNLILSSNLGSNSTNNVLLYIPNAVSNINTTFDKISTIPNATLAVMSNSTSQGAGLAINNTTNSQGAFLSTYGSNYKPGYTYDQSAYSKITIGTFLSSNKNDPFYSTSNKQWVNGSKIDFSGNLDFYGTGNGSNYAYVFWNNTNDLLQNQLTFKDRSNVSFNLDLNTKLTSGDGNGYGYSYVFEDGSSFKLWSKQNVFGNPTGNNVGLKMGSYDKETQTFGSGAKIIVAGVDGAQLSGDGFTNLGGKNYQVNGSLYSSSIVNNGEYNTGDVVFNLADGSKFNVSGTGINVLKSQYLKNAADVVTANTNNSGIYIRSATNITAATGMNITHNGNGTVVVKNVGDLNTTASGIILNSTSGNTMTVDMTKSAGDSKAGVINVNGGSGIVAGTNASSGNVNLNISGGIINISGTAMGFNFENSTGVNSHKIKGTTINLAAGSLGKVVNNVSSHVTLQDTHVNVTGGVAFNESDLTNVTFSGNDNSVNTITVLGNGTGFNLNSNLLAIQSPNININVTDSSGVVGTTGTGTAVSIAGGASDDIINVNDGIYINAKGATAIAINGTNGRTLVNEGSLIGNIVFNNGYVNNTITNEGVLSGGISAGNGNNTLNLMRDSFTEGTVTLGNGNNTVNIHKGSGLTNVTTGLGDNVFNLYDIDSTNSIGTLDSGGGSNNTLNLSNSEFTAEKLTLIKNFTNINLASSTIALLGKDNLASGNLSLDNTSLLTLTKTYNDDVGVSLSGAGNVNLEQGANATLTQNSSGFSGAWNVVDGSTLSTSSSDQLGSGTINIAGGLNIGQTSFNNKLVGAGIVTVNTNKNNFNFGSGVGKAFTGTVDLTNTNFTLSGDNTAVFADATLSASDGSKTTVSSTETISDLVLNGGTLAFDGNGLVNTDSLTVSKNSTIQINVDEISSSNIDTSLNLLDQNIGVDHQLINTATNSDFDVDNLVLQDLNGNSLASSVGQLITQKNTDVANASYGYSLIKDNGLGVHYALNALDLLTGKTLTIDSSDAKNKTLTTALSGSGNLVLATDSKGLTLNNASNSYTGSTSIKGGIVNLGTDGSLGKTSALTINKEAGLNLDSHVQTVGSLVNSGNVTLNNGTLTVSNSTTNSGAIDITGGSLVLNGGGSSSTTNGLTGNGNLMVSNGGFTVSGANGNLTGNTTISSSGEVILNDSGNLGSSAVNIDGKLTLNNNNTLVNTLTGNGSVNTNAAITLTGNNSGFSGKQVIGDTGKLTVNNMNQLGNDKATVSLSGANSSLILTDISGSVSNNISGTGALTLSGSAITLANGNNNLADVAGQINLNNSSTLAVVSNGQLNSAAGLNIASSKDTLSVASTGDFTLSNNLTGAGNIQVDTSNNTFNFGSNVGNAFAGTVDLKNTGFNLSGKNNLAKGTLSLSSGSKTTVAASESVGNLSLNGGNLSFNSNTAQVNTGNLTVNNDSTIQIDSSDVVSGDNLNLLDQNAGANHQLVNASGESELDLAKLTLQDLQGNSLDSSVQQAIISNNETVAKGSYGYALTNDNGLGVNYALSGLDILAGKTLTVDSSGAASKTLTAAVSGSGNLALTTDEKGLTVANSSNSYTGTTSVSGGTVSLGADGSLGATSGLTVNEESGLNLGGHAQTVGSLANSGKIELNNGTLTVSNSTANSGVVDITGGNLVLNGGSSTATGGLTGNGQLTVNSGSFAVSGANNKLAGTTTINDAGEVVLSDKGTLGSSSVAVGGKLTLNIDNSLANTLTGAGTVTTNAGVTLTGNNSQFSGTQVIGNAGTLTVNNVNALGSDKARVSLSGKDSTLNLAGVTGNVANNVAGSAGNININNAANVNLTGNNSDFAGIYKVDGNSTLNVSTTANLGKGAVTTNSGSTFLLNGFNGGKTTKLANLISGAGNVGLSGSSMTLETGNNNLAEFTGQINLNNSSTLAVVSNGQLNSAAGLNIASSKDTLSVASTGDFTLSNNLTGAGNIQVDTSNNTFNFGSNVGNAFAGTVDLKNTGFNLSGKNNLAKGTLSLSSGSKTTVAASESVGNLSLNGGNLSFNSNTAQVNTGNLTVNNDSTIQIDSSDVVSGDNLNLLDQNAGANHQLVNASGESELDLAKLTLQDLQGNSLDSSVQQAIISNNETVAKGSYGYALTNDNGLGVNYALSGLDILAGKTLTVDSSGAASKTLTAAVSGSGNLALTTDEKGLTVANSSNSYTGTTSVSGGTVSLGADGSLGATSGLTVNEESGLNLGGHAQTVGSLANSGKIELNNGTLTVSNSTANSGVVDITGGNLVLNGGSSTATGGLTGNGQLTVNSGSFAVSGANNKLAGTTTINDAGEVVLSDKGTLGSSSVAVGGKLTLNIDNSLANTLTGAGTVTTNAGVTLTGNNSQFSGTQVIGNAGTLTVNNVNALGSDKARVSLSGKDSTLNLAGVTGNVANNVAGSAGNININNAANVNLTGNNSDFAGIYKVDGNSTLNVSTTANLGKGAVTTNSGSTFLLNGFNGGKTTKLANLISGAGNVGLSGSSMTLETGNNNLAEFTGQINLNNSSTLAVVSNGQLNSAAGLNIASSKDTLSVASTGDFTLSNNLTGAGNIQVDTSNNTFNFGSNVGNAFAGTVNLNNTEFTLAGDNTAALTDATLSLSEGSKTTVSSEEAIGNLVLNGGTIGFNGDGVINTDNFSVDNNSIVQVKTDDISGGDVDSTLNLLDQNAGANHQLVNASGESELDLAKLTLQDLQGNSLDSSVQQAIISNNEIVAKGSYGYALTNDNGLGIDYALSGLDILAGKTLTVDSSSAASKTLTAAVSGSGNLALTTDEKGLTVANSSNSYTGTTSVSGGTVSLGADGSLGATSGLTVNEESGLNLGGHAQTVGSLANSGKIELNNGTLTVSNSTANSGVVDITGGNLVLNGGSSTATGGLTGNGQLTVNSGSFAVSGANNKLAGTTTINDAGEVVLSDKGTLGSSSVAVGGKLTLNIDNSLANTLTGAGTVTTNAGVTLTGNNSQFSGTQVIGNAGTLTVNNVNALGSDKARVSLSGKDSTLNLAGVTGNVANNVAGSAGNININNAANVNLTGNNSDFAGIYKVDGNSTLNVSTTANLGKGAVTTNSGSTFLLNGFNGGKTTKLANLISGAGNVGLSGSSMTLETGNNNLAEFTGQINLNNSSTLAVVSNGQLNSAAGLNIASSKDTLSVASTGDFTLSNNLTGAGNIQVDTSNNTFNFGSNVGNAFAGTVNLNNTEFTLAGDNTAALTDATLSLSEGSKTTVSSEEAIGNLVLNGGTIGFNGDGVINTDSLTVSKDTTIQINVNEIPNSNVDNSLNLLDQSAGANHKLVNTSKEGDIDLGKIILEDLDGNSLASLVNHTVSQAGEVVADATYGYALTNDNGLGVDYALSGLDILAGKTLTVDSSSAASKTLTAAVSGSGNLALTTDEKGLTVANSSNSYTGTTSVSGGTVSLGADGSLGATSGLTVNEESGLNLGGHAQTVGSLANSGKIELNNGTLTVSNSTANSGVVDITGGNLVLNGGSSTATGGLTGNGQLTVNSGSFAVSGANNKLAGTTTINDAGEVVLSDKGTLGSSSVAVGGKLTLNIDNSLANTLTGAGTVTTNAGVTLTGNNSQFSGTQVIGNAGTLTVNNVNALGSDKARVSLSGKDSTLNLAGVTGNVANNVAGSAGNININNAANVNLTGNNSDFAGIYKVDGNSTLNVSTTANLGKGAVTTNSGSTFLLNGFNGGKTTKLANLISGAGNVGLSGSSMTLETGNNNLAEFTGQINLNNSSTLAVVSNGQLNSAAGLNIASSKDTLSVASTGDFTLSNNLTGAGNIQVDTSNNTFNFGSNVGNAFAGTVNLNNTEFTLAGDNTTALTNANLVLSKGSNINVGDGVQKIDTLTTNGDDSKLVFNHITEENGIFNSEGTIEVNNLDLSGKANVIINLPVDVHPDISGNTVLQLDQGEEFLELVKAGNVTGSVSNLELKGANGQELPENQHQNMINNGSDVISADGYFNYKLTTGEAVDGLHVSYGLVGLNLKGQGKDALILESIENRNNLGSSHLTAKVEGTGDLAIQGENQNTIITIENADNSYTGVTDVRSGILKLGTNNTLGNTSELVINENAKTDLNGMTQTIGKLTNNSTLDLNAGSLTLLNGGSSTATNGLIGAGELSIQNGALIISGANDLLTANVIVNDTASITLNDQGSLGVGNISLSGNFNLNSDNSIANTLSGDGSVNVNANIALVGNNSNFNGIIDIADKGHLTSTSVNQLGSAAIKNEGNLLFNLNKDEILNNSISGTGQLEKEGNGTLTFNESNTYTGKTDINAGALWINKGVTLGGIDAGDITIKEGAALNGAGTVNGNVINFGTLNVVNNAIAKSRELSDSTIANFTINNNLDNHSNINIGAEKTAGNMLTINGDYTGSDKSTIFMNTDLGDDETSVVDKLVISGHASGSTAIHITDIGSGEGGSTSKKGIKIIDTNSSDVDAFVLDNVVVKGAYEYLLNRDSTDQDWYLTSYKDIRADFGQYIANMDAIGKSLLPSFGAKPSGALAGGAGGLRSMDRIAKGDSDDSNSVWMINTAGRSRGEAAGGQIKYHYNEYSSVIGIDHTFYNDDVDNRSAFVFGVMTGTTYAKSSSNNRNTGSDGDGSVNGNTFGIYGSWFFDGDNPLSPFVDYYLSYGHYNNRVSTQGNDEDKYKSNVFSYTLQGGYPIALNDNWVFEPQAQISYLHYSIDNHTDHSGTNIDQSVKGNTVYRVGSYFYPMQGNIKPYVGVNLWYDNTRSTVQFDDASVSSDKAGFMLESKVGVTTQIKNNFTVSGEINYRQGQNNSQNYSANIGLKYQF
ncbi:ESPR-type extended signal peptide-containing protein [Orbus mooreae]|uniref:ESPR-type extended signal peptide-containing protein n=1 Tax=Orbus mooreae TaxID=3074107 RepID=UPI00370D0922